MLTRDKNPNNGKPQDPVSPTRPAVADAPFAPVPPVAPVSGGDGNDGCKLVVANLSAYLDSELDPEQSEIIAAHLNQCAHCATEYDALQTINRTIQREWRDNAPLPSSSEMQRSIDAIMDALPLVPEAPKTFAPKRRHDRTRWMRFSTGLAGFILFLGLMWSSYQLGYVQGRRSVQTSTASVSSSASSVSSEPTYHTTLISANAPATGNALMERR